MLERSPGSFFLQVSNQDSPHNASPCLSKHQHSKPPPWLADIDDTEFSLTPTTFDGQCRRCRPFQRWPSSKMELRSEDLQSPNRNSRPTKRQIVRKPTRMKQRLECRRLPAKEYHGHIGFATHMLRPLSSQSCPQTYKTLTVPTLPSLLALLRLASTPLQLSIHSYYTALSRARQKGQHQLSFPV